jgi:hypothetical protein
MTLDLRILGLTLLSAFSRRRALDGVAEILFSWNADPMLLSATLRLAPLRPWPPPGSSQIVSRYPHKEAAKA